MKFTTPVLKGHGRGKTLGFPTFNLKIPPKFKARPGIYAGWAWIKRKKYPGAFHSGPIPVFNSPTPSLEVFVLDFDSDQPVTQLTFELIHYLRPIHNFPNPAALAHQISLDVNQIHQLLK